jgi:sugar-specific transcriptional regulator TrmB
MVIEEALSAYGLSDKEIKIYLVLLPIGTVTLQQIAKRTEYPRTTVYNTVNYLIARGLISQITKKGVHYYTAAEPTKLKDKLDEKMWLLDSALPGLEELRKDSRTASSVEMFEGLKGVFTILTDVLQNEDKNEKKYYFGSYSKSKEILKHLPYQTRTVRLEKKIYAKIVTDPYIEEDYSKKNYKKYTDIRFTPLLADFPLMVFIYENNVSMFTIKGDLVGMIIRNKEFAIAMRMIFEIYWSQAKPLEHYKES